MRFSDFVLEELATMVVGDVRYFPRRSSYYITKFFESCGLPFKHDGTTRRRWVTERLTELNRGLSKSPDFPSDEICRVISRLFEPDDFARANRGIEIDNPEAPADVNKALEKFNELVTRYGIVAYLDKTGRCFLKSTGSGFSSEEFSQYTRPLSQEELAQRKKLAAFLDNASEDVVIERVLVPLFQRLGFRRVSATGHKDKLLEYGKDLWMKYQIPTGHWLYFCAQVKKDKIDSNNASGSKNVANVLAQTRMAIDHPIFDPEANRQFLLDHIFIISAGEITKPARTWLVGELDTSQRRHIIFMDREELLDQSARILLDLRIEDDLKALSDEDIPF
jgi:hypothetical protein